DAPGGSPFGLGSGGVSSATVQFHSMLAGQLRNCFHLYGNLAGAGLVRRFDLIPPLPFVENLGFEPDDVRQFDASLTGFTYGPGPHPWGQGDPWLIGPDPSSPFSRGLSAAELMASLGPTQSCPFPMNNGLVSGPDDCSKPLLHSDANRGSNDLRPDLAAALAYIGEIGR